MRCSGWDVMLLQIGHLVVELLQGHKGFHLAPILSEVRFIVGWRGLLVRFCLRWWTGSPCLLAVVADLESRFLLRLPQQAGQASFHSSLAGLLGLLSLRRCPLPGLLLLGSCWMGLRRLLAGLVVQGVPELLTK